MMKDLMDLGPKEAFQLAVKLSASTEAIDLLGDGKVDRLIEIVFFEGDDDPRDRVFAFVDSVEASEENAAASILAQQMLEMYFLGKRPPPDSQHS